MLMSVLKVGCGQGLADANVHAPATQRSTAQDSKPNGTTCWPGTGRAKCLACRSVPEGFLVKEHEIFDVYKQEPQQGQVEFSRWRTGGPKAAQRRQHLRSAQRSVFRISGELNADL